MRLTILAAALVLSACGGSGTPEADDSVAADRGVSELGVDAASADANEATDALLGTICYRYEDDAVTEGLEIEVAESGSVTGYHFGTIHDEAAAYFAAFETELSEGQFGDTDEVTFQTYTEVDGDTQTGEETWTITADGARITAFEDGGTLTPFSCEELLFSIWPPIEE